MNPICFHGTEVQNAITKHSKLHLRPLRKQTAKYHEILMLVRVFLEGKVLSQRVRVP